MNALWRAVTRTRTMRSAAADFGPPPGARNAVQLAKMNDAELLGLGLPIADEIHFRRVTAQTVGGQR